MKLRLVCVGKLAEAWEIYDSGSMVEQMQATIELFLRGLTTTPQENNQS